MQCLRMFYIRLVNPLGNGTYERHVYSVESREECRELLVYYVEWFDATNFDTDKFGKPQAMCTEVKAI